MIICTYDISNTKLRSQFSKNLKRYGRRIQYSVFEIENSPRILNGLLLDIEHTFRKKFTQSDSVLIFQLCAADVAKIRRYGYAVLEEPDLLVFK